MNKITLKRKASMALIEVIKAVRKYIEAEDELEKMLAKENKLLKSGDND